MGYVPLFRGWVHFLLDANKIYMYIYIDTFLLLALPHATQTQSQVLHIYRLDTVV